MLLAYSDILHCPVAAADPGERVGSVVDLVAEPTEHRVVAFAVHVGGWFGSTRFLSPDDVVEYDPHALIVPTADALVDPDEIVRAKKCMDEKMAVLKRPVVTDRGETLGHVFNYVVDTDTAGIVRYYVKSLLGPERIIPTSSIIEVTARAFVVKANRKDVKVPAVDTAEAAS